VNGFVLAMITLAITLCIAAALIYTDADSEGDDDGW
jgi:hypothetical protein